MKKLLTILIITLLAYSCANKNNVFQDPSLQKDNAKKDIFFYKVNKEKTSMPVFFRLPQDKKNTNLNFEKVGSSSVDVILNNDLNGWNAFSSKSLSSNGTDFGLIIDFAEGGVYEMPSDDVKIYLSNFTLDDVFNIKELLPGKNNMSFTNMVVIDAAATYNKEELKHLVLLNDLNLANQQKNMITEAPVKDTPKVESDDTFIKVSKNVVVLDRPIITAAVNGQYDRLLKLLNNNGNINELNPDTLDNALIASIMNGHEDIANMLLNKGINAHHKNKNNQSALHIASNFGFYDTVDMLLKAGLSVSDRDAGGNTPLMYAAASPNTYVVDLLVDNGAKLEDRNTDGETPLLIAARTGNTRTVDNLISKGADISAVDNDGNGAIMKAVAENNIYTLQNLLSKGLNPNVKNSSGYSPLMVTVGQGNTQISSDSLKAGADINDKDPAGNTPLMNAALLGDTPTVRELLKYNPDIKVRNNQGQNAYELAQDKGFAQIQRILGENFKEFDLASITLFDKVAKNDIHGAIEEIKKGANPNAKDKNTGNTPIFTAVVNNYLDLTKALIKNGCDVNVQNNLGNTPLIVAVASSDATMVDALIKGKSDVNATNKNGDTALIWAVKLKAIDMVRLLLTAGADPNAKNNDGVSPYLIAYNEGPKDILGLLQAAGGYK